MSVTLTDVVVLFELVDVTSSYEAAKASNLILNPSWMSCWKPNPAVIPFVK